MLTTILEAWFSEHKRDLPWRQSYDPYHVWVSEVMLQQTRMEVVVPYFERFIATFPAIASLAAADVDDVVSLWSGLGYYRRARMLHAGARYVRDHHGGALPDSLEELQAIAGIGRYTAGAIASIAFDFPAPIVDGNVARVLARIYALDDPLGSAALAKEEWRIAQELVLAAASPRNLNQALMELGALVCTPRSPRCERCPAARMCEAYGRDEVDRLPVLMKRAESVEIEVPLFVVRDSRDRVLLERHYGALMSGMFHLPHGSSALLDDSSSRFIARKELGTFRHTITHRRVTFRLIEAELNEELADRGVEAFWATSESLGEIAHPSYVRKALRQLFV